MVNTILAKRINHIVAKGDNPVWPKGSKSRGFSNPFRSQAEKLFLLNIIYRIFTNQCRSPVFLFFILKSDVISRAVHVNRHKRQIRFLVRSFYFFFCMIPVIHDWVFDCIRFVALIMVVKFNGTNVYSDVQIKSYSGKFKFF